MNLINTFHDRCVHTRRVDVLARRIARMLEVAFNGTVANPTVLDVGAGDGQVAAAIMCYWPDARFTGVDVLVRATTAIPVLPYDGRKLPFADGAFDAVTVVDVLHHTDEPAAMLAECARVARHCVIVKDHVTRSPLDHATLRFMDYVGNAHHGVRLPHTYLSPRQWEAAFARAGLQEHSRQTKLSLYRRPADWCFGRGLHFIARLDRIAAATTRERRQAA